MIGFIKKFIEKEYTLFQRLSPEGQRLLLSFLLYAVAEPMIGIFTNTFLWQQTHDLTLIVAYNIAFFLIVPIGFYINGLLLKRFRSTRLYWFGCILQGLVPLFVVFLDSSSPRIVAVLGAVFGLSGGFFWANRNLLTLKVTQSRDRLYFIGLESSSGTFISVFVPFFIGWFLVLGTHFDWYSTDTAYKAMALLGIGILTFVGSLAKDVECITCKPWRISLPRQISQSWKKIRGLEVFHGFLHGLETVVPTIIILTFIGSEASIGTLQAIAALCSAIAVYTIGRRARQHHRASILGMAIVCGILASSAFSLWFSAFGAIVYVIIASLTTDFRWLALTPITWDTIDTEESVTKIHQYPYLCDRELYLNLGRVIGLVTFFALSMQAPSHTLRYILLAGALVQIFVYLIAKQLSRAPNTSPETTP